MILVENDSEGACTLQKRSISCHHELQLFTRFHELVLPVPEHVLCDKPAMGNRSYMEYGKTLN